MPGKINYKTGEIINGVKFIKELGPQVVDKKIKYRIALFECPYCGKEFKAKINHIRSGDRKSCGCLKRMTSAENSKKYTSVHNLSKHPLYRVWDNMKYRCYNSNSRAYKNYGGRGIAVCEEWRNDFKTFYNWAISNGWRRGLEIDRIDNDKGYSPENCRFVPSRENTRNRRTTKLNDIDVGVIRSMKKKFPHLRLKDFAMVYNTSIQLISDILNGRAWVNI